MLTAQGETVLLVMSAEQQRLSYESGHRGNVFQARAFPSTGLAVIVTCAADGQVVPHFHQLGSRAAEMPS
jgi:hypothetical protein